MAAEQLLGDILIQHKLVTKDAIDQALRTQVGGNQRLGSILVRMKVITADQLVDALANQLDLPICDVPNSFSSNSKKTIPRYLCQQYGVLPLRLKDNNILELAMANPADHSARNELETFTGKVIEPRLARLSDIETAIPKYISWSLKDYFSPRLNTKVTRVAVACCFVLLSILGWYTYHYIQVNSYGTITTTETSTLYKNLDLTLDFNHDGDIKFSGRGAYADGSYTVTFPTDEVLLIFLSKRKSDLSDKQQKWLHWVIDQNKKTDTSKSKSVALN